MPHSLLAASDIFRMEREAAKPLSPINGSIHSRVSTSLASSLEEDCGDSWEGEYEKGGRRGEAML